MKTEMPVEEFNSAKMLFWKRFMEMDENPKSKNDDVRRFAQSMQHTYLYIYVYIYI